MLISKVGTNLPVRDFLLGHLLLIITGFHYFMYLGVIGRNEWVHFLVLPQLLVANRLPARVTSYPRSYAVLQTTYAIYYTVRSMFEPIFMYLNLC